MMKGNKKYVLVALLILAFGVVSTMAFQLSSTTSEIPNAYAVDASSTNAQVDSVKIRPSKSGDRMIIKITLSSLTENHKYNIGVELLDTTGTDGYYDLSGSGVTITPEANGNSTLASGYYETTYTANSDATQTVTIKMDNSDIWQDVDDIMITIADH